MLDCKNITLNLFPEKYINSLCMIFLRDYAMKSIREQVLDNKTLGLCLKWALLARNKVIQIFNPGIMQDDVYLLSFPKCGRTGLVLLLGKIMVEHFKLWVPNVMYLRGMRFYNKKIPRIKVSHDDDPHLKHVKNIEQNKNGYKGKKVIFLVRDPRDTIVSLYFQHTKRVFDKRGKPLYKGKSISKFIREKRGSFDSILEFYNVWYKNRRIPKGFLLVRYEDIFHGNKVKELKKILNFMGLNSIRESTIKKVVNEYTFEKMKKLEKENRFMEGRLKPGDKTDAESFKMRKGKVGGHKEHLSRADVKYLTSKIKKELPSYFGY
jgi:hypothetical protein